MSAFVSRSSHAVLLYVLGGIVGVGVDQATKQWAMARGGVHFNAGVSFGWAAVVPGHVLTGVLEALVVVLGVLIGLFWSSWSVSQRWAATLVLAGGVSNLLDRLYWGGVRDWLEVPGLGIRNNLADWMITMGVLCWCSWEVRQWYATHQRAH